MRSVWVLILAIALSIASVAEFAPYKRAFHDHKPVKTERVVVGSLADISARYENGKPVTVIHILDFSKDVYPNEPTLLQIRLCGDQADTLGQVVHTNISLVYDLASHSALTGCLTLLGAEPWQDGSRWQTVTFNPPTNVRWSRRAKSSLGIIDDSYSF